MTNLADIASVLSGVSPPKGRELSASYVRIGDLKEGGAPSTKGPHPSAKRATRITASDILVTSRGDDVSAMRPSGPMVGAYVALDVYLVRPQLDRVDPDYLALALNSDEALKQLKTASTAGKLPRIPKQALENVRLSVPSLQLQRKIAEIGALAKHFETLQKERAEAQLKLRSAILAKLLKIRE